MSKVGSIERAIARFSAGAQSVGFIGDYLVAMDESRPEYGQPTAIRVLDCRLGAEVEPSIEPGEGIWSIAWHQLGEVSLRTVSDSEGLVDIQLSRSGEVMCPSNVWTSVCGLPTRVATYEDFGISVTYDYWDDDAHYLVPFWSLMPMVTEIEFTAEAAAESA